MTFLAPSWMEKLGYTAMNDRQVIASVLSPGVMEPNAMKCSAGSGFQSVIAEGRAAVEGNYQTAQGLYVVQNQGVTSVTHPTPSPTLPRIDQIGVKVYDSTDGGDVSDKSEAMVLEGTPTSGATLGNKLGIATLPKNFLRFAYVLVPAAVGSSASFTYEDARTGPGIVKYLEGVAAARPAAGLKGRIYYATDTEVYSFDTGSAWKSGSLVNMSSSWVTNAANSGGGFVKEWEHEFSATREAEVMVGVGVNAPPKIVVVEIGGVRVLWPDGSSAPNMSGETFFTVRVPAGQKIRFFSTGEFKVSCAVRIL